MGLIHLDAGLIIAFLDGDDAHHDASRAALSDALGRGDRLAIAASALAECLVGPARRSQEAIDLVRTVIGRLPVSVVDLNAEIANRGRYVMTSGPPEWVEVRASCSSSMPVAGSGRQPRKGGLVEPIGSHASFAAELGGAGPTTAS